MKPHHGDPNQALVWGGCGRQRSLARYKANPTSFLYQANFPGLGRGLRGASGTPAKYAEYQADFLGLGRGLRGASGTPAKFAGYKASPTSFLYQANFPGLGRGLFGSNQAPDRLAIIHRDRIHHYIALITRN